MQNKAITFRISANKHNNSLPGSRRVDAASGTTGIPGNFDAFGPASFEVLGIFEVNGSSLENVFFGHIVHDPDDGGFAETVAFFDRREDIVRGY